MGGDRRPRHCADNNPLAERPIAPQVTALFVAGGVGGLLAGRQIGRRLSGPALQKAFAVAIVAVPILVLARNLIG